MTLTPRDMILFVIVTQFLGVVMVYMVVPIYLIPYIIHVLINLHM